jgi:hypothetical protein
MIPSALLVLLLSMTGPTPTTVPDAPGAGLGLEPPPTVVPRARPDRSPPSEMPDPALPATLAALIGGMALLAARARRIETAESRIRDALQDNLFSDVGRDDLMDILGRIERLDVFEATAAISRLTDDELGVWMRELGGWRGGLDRTEQAEYLAALAGRLRPDQLARLTDHGKTDAVVAASLTAAPEHWHVELALRLWARRGPGDDGWNNIAALVEAAPAGALQTALSTTNLAALGAELFETFQRHPEASAAVDLEAAHRLVLAARTIPDAGVKAELFRVAVIGAASVAGTRVRGLVEVPALNGGLTGLLRSDASGVVDELNHRVDPHANVISVWVAGMIRADRLDELDVLLAELAGAPDRLEHFTVPGSDPANPYPNASNLGYYVGAYARAIDVIADRAEHRVDLVARLFALFTGVVPVPGGGSVGVPLGPLVDSHAASVVEDLRLGATSLKQTLWGLAKPRTADGTLWNGTGTSQFQDAWQEVVEIR